MLTKQDLQALEKLLSSQIGKLEERLEQRLEESTLELQKELILLKAEMKREFKKVRNDQNLIIKFFNEDYLDLKKKVEDLEHKVSIL